MAYLPIRPRITTFKYACVETDDPTVVTVYTDLVGSSETRTLEPGDRVYVVEELIAATNGPVSGAKGVVKQLIAGQLVTLPRQPKPGEIVSTTCSPADVGYLAGNISVVTEDGYLFGTWAGALNYLFSQQ